MIAYLLDGVIFLDIPSAEATIVELDSRITQLIRLGLDTEQPDGVEPLLKLKVDHHERLLEEADAYEYSINRGLS